VINLQNILWWLLLAFLAFTMVRKSFFMFNNKNVKNVSSAEAYKDIPILVHCASGGRSPSAVKALINSEFTQVYHLNRGLTSWRHQLK
jgi:rhodanese-related sulfurtransferase